MATATQVISSSPSLSLSTWGSVDQDDSLTEAIRLASLIRPSLNKLNTNPELAAISVSHGYTADEIVALPMETHRIPDELYSLPRRKSARHELAVKVASLLFPTHEGSLAAVIRYDEDRVRLRGCAVLQRKYDIFSATIRHGRTTAGLTGGAPPGANAPMWTSRILSQGPWNEKRKPIPLSGVQAIPMPVRVAEECDLAPFLDHLQHGGNHEITGEEGGEELEGGAGEPYYAVKGAEFRKGVVYQDGRMDLCKMVVGPDHIWKLMDSLRPNHFVRHFLLGNNIIGPSGARAVARFVEELPDRMDTWYLAGNCIDGPSFKVLVDALVKSPAVTNVWLKRNPLGPGAANDVYRLVTETPNLCTLDLDQSELGDEGVAAVFRQLSAFQGRPNTRLPLRHIYMNGTGASHKAAKAIGEFLASPFCALESIYLSSNPLGDAGVEALAAALPKSPYLTRLLLQSVGVSTQGAIAMCESVAGHPALRTLDLGQAYNTQDLGQAYNYIEDGAVPAMEKMIRTAPGLEYFNLGHVPMTPRGAGILSAAVRQSTSLLVYQAFPIVADADYVEPKFVPSQEQAYRDPGTRDPVEIEASKVLRAHLEANVRARYKDKSLNYADFLMGERRWLVNDRNSIRKIDSVYRNRDAGKARRGLMTLVKNWEEGDDTLDQVQNAQWPSCSLRRN